MKAVVIGGHGRDTGKTRVAEQLIRSSRSLGWTAVKVAPHSHASAGIESGNVFFLIEEREGSARGDTRRYLAAGARRALWLSVARGRLAEAFPALREALAGEQHVVFESNGILECVRPSAFLFALNASKREFKPSARRRLQSADAFVVTKGILEEAAWRGAVSGALRRRPIFTISERERASAEIRRFVLRRIERAAETKLV